MSCGRKLGPFDCCSVIQGDCLELMKQLPDGCVEIALTSPPYNKKLKYDVYSDDLSEEEFWTMNSSYLSEIYRTCAADGSRAYIVCPAAIAFWISQNAEGVGWKWGQLLTWCKPNFSCSPDAVSGDWNYMTEQIVLLRKGKRSPMLNGIGTTHSFLIEAVPQSQYDDGRVHPAQFPIRLPLRLLSRTPGETILDPFLGSGTTAVAAKKLGRHFLGFEISEEYCRIARERIALVEAQPSLFEPKPEQLSLTDAR
jgi:site-specific DNA-methyltransferase (adenine-specific)